MPIGVVVLGTIASAVACVIAGALAYSKGVEKGLRMRDSDAVSEPDSVVVNAVATDAVGNPVHMDLNSVAL